MPPNVRVERRAAVWRVRSRTWLEPTLILGIDIDAYSKAEARGRSKKFRIKDNGIVSFSE